MNEILNAILDRRTVRDFKPDPIKEEDVATILEAGHQAPSEWNRQPWHFTVVEKQSILNRIEVSAREEFQKNFPDQAKAMPWIVAEGFHYFYGAPTVIFVSGQTGLARGSQGDCAIAVTNMVYAAHSLGIQSCVVVTAIPAFATEQGPEFKADLEIPEGYEPMYALVLGYTSKPMPTPAPRKENFVNFIK
jgi:nitroreductase